MMPDASSLMNNVVHDLLVLNLVDICLDNTFKLIYKLFLCFAKILKTDNSEITENWLVNF